MVDFCLLQAEIACAILETEIVKLKERRNMGEEYQIELMPGFVLVEPFRPDEGIVRTEKKYDRHALATILRMSDYHGTDLEPNTPNCVPGKTVVAYDDSNAIETQLVWGGKKRNVEIIRLTDIAAYLTKGKHE